MKKIITWAIVAVALTLGWCSAFSQSIPNVAFPTSEAVADTYTVNITNYGSSYNDKVALINFRTANSGPATLNITPSGGSALGARPLRKFDGSDWVPLSSGDIRGDSSLYFVHYSTACGCLRIVPQGTGSGPGGSQDLQDVLDLGSTATVTTDVSVTTTEGITFSSDDGGGNQMGVELATTSLGLGNGTNGINISGSGVTTQTPSSGDNTTKIATTAFVNTATTGTQDLFVSAAAMWPRASNPCADLAKTEVSTSLFNIQSLDFDQSTDEFAQMQVVLPRKWNNGTVTVVVYWTAASGSGDVIWSINGGAYSNDDALSTALGTAQTTTDTFITANDVHVTSATSAITIAGTPADSDILAIQVSRDADNGSDTLNADAKLLGISIRITTDAAKDN